MAVSNVALFGAAFLTPVIVGKMTKTMGWQWSFYFVAIFLGASLPLTFFFVPETAFRRPGHLNTDFKRSGDQGEATQSHASLSGASNDERKELSPESNDATETAIRIFICSITPAIQWSEDGRELLQAVPLAIPVVLPPSHFLGKSVFPQM